LFPLDLNVPLGFASGNIEGLGETKLTVSLGAREMIIVAASRFVDVPDEETNLMKENAIPRNTNGTKKPFKFY